MNDADLNDATPSRQQGGRLQSPRRSAGARRAAVLVAALAGSAMATYAVQSQTAAPPTSGNLSPQAARQAPAIPNFVDLVRSVKPAVVSVRVKSDMSPQVLSENGSPFEGTPFERFFRDLPDWAKPFNGKPRRFVRAQGSGFFISADGYIVTNNHVVAKARTVEVVTDDGKKFEAKVVGTDKSTDLALLQVKGRSDFPFVNFADAEPKVGEWVVAMGNPFGLGGTVTAGIVSAQGRNIGSGPYDDFLQIDAAVNRGNSGGPTFDVNGRVIGVNTAIYSPTGASVGIAFSIPATTAMWVVEQLKERGYVERSWLGVKVQRVTPPIAESLGLKEPEGALVAEVEPDSPAAKADLKTGDVIKSVDGAAVSNGRELALKIASTPPQTAISIGYVRGGASETVEATVVQMPGQVARRAPARPQGSDGVGKLGLTVAPAQEVQGAGNRGLAVLHVDPAGKAADLGFAPGDVIVRAGGEEVDGVEDLNRAMETASADGKRSMLLLVRRDDEQRFVAVPVSAG